MHVVRGAGSAPSHPPSTPPPLAWTQVVLTGLCFVFTGFLVTIGAVDVYNGAWITLVMVAGVHAVLFGKRISGFLRRLRRAGRALFEEDDQL
ncbi:hypothetical protein [Nocardia africana]